MMGPVLGLKRHKHGSRASQKFGLSRSTAWREKTSRMFGEGTAQRSPQRRIPDLPHTMFWNTVMMHCDGVGAIFIFPV
jgi:hypothetical protein